MSTKMSHILKQTCSLQFEATINEKVFPDRLSGTVWDVSLKVVSVWDKKRTTNLQAT